MTSLFQIIFIGKRGNWHQAHRLVGMKDVEKGEELSTAKAKGRRKGFGGRRTRKTFISCWGGQDGASSSMPNALTLATSTSREGASICLIPGSNFKVHLSPGCPSEKFLHCKNRTKNKGGQMV